MSPAQKRIVLHQNTATPQRNALQQLAACPRHVDGGALVFVLSVVALLSVAVLLMLGASSKQVRLSQGSSSKLGADELLAAATVQTLGDLRQEIRAGSVEVATSGGIVRYPATPLGAVPDRSSALSPSSVGSVPPPNLLKQSARGRSTYDAAATFNGAAVYPQSAAYPAPVRASAVSSGTGGLDAVSATRWNRPLLLPRLEPQSATNLTPAVSGTLRFGGNARQIWEWKTPDWVYMQGDGKNPIAMGAELRVGRTDPVVGRYAWQMYDIGGLLDLNVAGYDPDPNVVGDSVAARRGGTGLADLTQVGMSASQLKLLLQHRNAATLNEPDTVVGRPSYGNRYANFLLSSQSNFGFLRVGGAGVSGAPSNRAFGSRSGMQGFLQQLAANDAERAALLEAMQVLTHFSRALEQPSFKPGFYNPLATGSTPASPVFTRPGIVPPAGRVDDCLYPSNTISNTLLSTNDVRKSAAYGGPLPWEMALGNNRGGNDAWGTVAERGGDAADQRALQDVVNPGMLEVRVGAKADATKAYAFLRADGSPAFPGEALVKKRFALERLSWLTYKGPSALLPATDPLFNPAGTVQAIYNCFGLTWTKDTSGSSFWAYDHGKKGGILRLEELVRVDATRGLPREPDFFELLKAAIGVGSLGKSAVASHQTSLPWDCATWQQVRDRSTTFQLLEIGANLIDQYDADSYPTIVKLPNPDPSLAATANRYAPALFTARGVEDLPYFYRFHWRGIENAVDLPNQPLPAPGGIAEITESLAAFAGSKFKCGTTSIIGIPELWNPHALNAGGVAAGLAPEAFRIAAASETPSDLLDPPKDPANALDKGLSMLPKLGDLPTINTTSKLWLQMVNSTWFYFVVRPVGFFSYSIGSNYSPSWLHTQVLSTLCNPMYYNTANWTWSWPLDNQQTTGMTYLGAGSTDYRPTTLFWNSVSSYAEAPSDLIFGNRVSNYFMAFAPLWRLPDTVTSDATFPKQPMPTNWPAGTSRFSGQLFGPVASPADFPTLGSGTICYKLNDGRFFAWDVNSKNYNEMQWPTTPDPTFTFTTNGYAAGAGSLKYTGGKVVPFPYPAYRYYLTALSDRVGVRREIFESYPTATIPPGTPTPAAGGNAGNNRAVDLRGTELLFSLGNNSLFREPTPLCHPGLPLGSALAAGADNFFSAPPHSGSVLAEDGKRWVGFSLGEVPSQFVVAAKLFKRDKTGAYRNASFPAAGLYWAVDGNDPAMDLFQNKLGVAYSSPSQNWMVTTPAGAPVLPGPQSFYKLRFFQVPVNLAGIQRTQLTIRLQYKEPLSGKWVTYDERLVDVNPDDSSRWSSSPVLGKSELQPARLPATQDANGAVAWIDNKRTLGHSRPFVTSYDPRSPRFGHPMRSGYNWPQTVRGTNARDLLLLNSAPTDPWDAALWPRGSYNLTDRPGNGVVGLPVAGTLPCIVASRWLVPAYWSNWFYYYNGLTFRDGYDYAIGAKPADANGSPQWWAQGKHLVSGRILYQMPSANAADYGWYPRYTKTPPAGSMPSSAIKAGSASSDTAIPAFFNDSPSSYYADTLRMGAFSENVPPGPASTADPNAPYRQAYADPDDVFRRASGGFAASGGYTGAIEGLPMGQGDTLQSANRPVILNRPFRSVAEMGHAFRGAPWKNISFFLPETADAALLDVFCLTDPPASDAAGGLPLVAGKVNLNTRQEPVLRALLSGALKDELTSGSLGVGSGSEAAKAAATLLDRTTGGKAWQGPFANVSELAGKLFAKDLSTTPTDPGVFTSTVFRTVTEPSRNPDISAGKDRVDWHYTGLSADLDLVFGASKDRKTQRMRESVLRALVDCGQTRVWNVMLDVIVQAGRLPVGASRLEHFVREGEVRAWVYAAIDRFTGEILDQQVEMVSE